MKTKRTGDVLRPLALMALAGGLFIWLLWLNAICLDECASKFALSEKVARLHRLSSLLLLLQLVVTLGLVLALEVAIGRGRKTDGAEHHGGG